MWEYILLTVGAIAVIAFSSIGWWIGKFNTLTIAVQDIKTQWSNVLTEYQRRADLILNLARTAKGYAKFERDTLVGVAKARASLDNAKNLKGNDKAKAMGGMSMIDSALSRLMVVVEQYPNLQAIEQFNELSDELKMTENRVNIARTDYNEIVRDYNILVQTFPSNIVANHYGFKTDVFFEAEDSVKKAPVVDVSID